MENSYTHCSRYHCHIDFHSSSTHISSAVHLPAAPGLTVYVTMDFQICAWTTGKPEGSGTLTIPKCLLTIDIIGMLN